MVLVGIWRVVAGADLRLDGINSSRLAATALYTTSPSVAYLRISLRIHHNGKITGLARHHAGWNSPLMSNDLTCCADMEKATVAT